MKYKKILFAFITAAFSSLTLSAQDHGHLNVGAAGRTQDDPLSFDNGADFHTASLYVKTLNLAKTGKYAGYYEGNISFTVLHSTDPFGEIDPAAPAPGSFILAEIVSVEGPAGGEFGFWDVESTTAPTHSIPAGTTDGAYRFELSNRELGAGQPGGDPFGHIHGRRFTATKTGLYTVGFRALDVSTNGAEGGPIHTPSPVLHIYFQAGVNIVSVKPIDAGSARITSALPAHFLWQLESKDSLPAAGWVPVSFPVVGDDHLVEFLDDQAVSPKRFYRLTGTPIEP